jgi:hypothetical protein
MKNHISNANVGEVWLQSGGAGAVIWLITSRERESHIKAVCIDVIGSDYMYKALLLKEGAFTSQFDDRFDDRLVWIKI